MAMFNFFKISKRVKDRLPMVLPGTQDNSFLPGAGNMSAGLSLDYSAIQSGGIDSNVPFNHVDDDNQHYVKYCSCGNIIQQCRCPSQNKKKTIIENGCESCNDVVETKENKSDDPYNDDSKARGSYVGSKEEGFAFRHNLDYGSSLTARAFPDYPEYSNPDMYTQVMERPDANTTPLFNLFNTYFVDDDEVEILEDEEDVEPDVIEIFDEEMHVKKQAFVKKAITYDSNSIIQKLINIPQVKSLIDQQASGYVDKIIVTTPSTDLQQTQQELQSNNPQQLFDLKPISGDPFGHVWIGEDPSSHQKKPLDKIVRIDKVTDLWGTLVTILHEITHHRHPDWSESQVESEAANLAGTVKQFLEKTSGKKRIIFIKNNLRDFPIVECDVADTYQKQVIGLQNHNALSYKSGMLFPYNKPQSLSFWMGKVSFPIDIIFADANDVILKVFHNCMPNSSDIYSCGNVSRVIEVVGSFCAFHDINPGDHIMAVDDERLNEHEKFTKHILEKIKNIKIQEQQDLEMTDWNVKLVIKKQPDSRRFMKVTWTPEDYKAMKADILVNPDPLLISAALKEMSLEKLVRHALLHILAGHKEELPEDQEYEMITSKLFEDNSPTNKK